MKTRLRDLDIRAKSFEDFIGHLQLPGQHPDEPSTPLSGRNLYRGVTDAENHKLVPEIGRSRYLQKETILTLERLVFTEFKRRAPQFLARVPLNDWDWLFLCQHYRIPTRLLDWTLNPLVALYFATRGNKQRDRAVYHFEVNAWITPDFCPSPFEVTDTAALLPGHIDQRIANQAAAFTIHPDPSKALEAVSGPMSKITICASAAWSIQKWLAILGINESFIFPSLDQLAANIREEFFEKPLRQEEGLIKMLEEHEKRRRRPSDESAQDSK